MTALFIPCMKCGNPLPVDEETLRNAAALGHNLQVAHDNCDATAPPAVQEETLRTFRCTVTLVEVTSDGDDRHEETMAMISHTTTARNFPEAVNGPLTEWLNGQWPKFQEQSVFADMPTPG